MTDVPIDRSSYDTSSPGMASRISGALGALGVNHQILFYEKDGRLKKLRCASDIIDIGNPMQGEHFKIQVEAADDDTLDWIVKKLRDG